MEIDGFVPEGAEQPEIVQITAPEGLRRQLIREVLFPSAREAADLTLERGLEHGFVAGLKFDLDFGNEVARSPIIQGRRVVQEGKVRHSISLREAQEELTAYGNVMSLIRLHTHPPQSAFSGKKRAGLSRADVGVWQMLGNPTPFFPRGGLAMYESCAPRPISCMLDVEPDANTLYILSQTADTVDLEALAAFLDSPELKLLLSLGPQMSAHRPDVFTQNAAQRFRKLGFEYEFFSLKDETKIEEYFLSKLPQSFELQKTT